MSLNESLWKDQPASRPRVTGRWNRAAGLAMFTGLAALSGATAVVVLHRLAVERPALQTGSLGNVLISRPAASALARGTPLRLDDAHRSGNFEVFRGMAAPGFQSINSATDLTRIFAWLRKERFAFDLVSGVEDAELSVQTVEPRGLLRLTGRIRARPEPVHFDLMYQDIAGEWRLFGIALFKG